MTDTIAVQELSKWFGAKVAVSEVTISFRPGLTGLLGPNGAGKTTLMRVIAGLQRPSQGTVAVLGLDPRRDPSVYGRIALVPEDDAIYEHLNAWEFVRLAARLAQVDEVTDRVARAIQAVDLADVANRRLGGFSKGMRQRAKVAAALVSDPDVLLLDEPLNGADPVQRAHLIGLFRELAAAGRTVLVSSHVLAEVERMADRVVAMVDGRLAAVGSVASIRAAMTDRPRRVFIETPEPRRLAAVLIGLDGVVGIGVTAREVRIETSDARELARQLPGLAVDAAIGIDRIEPADESLESVFRYLVEHR